MAYEDTFDYDTPELLLAQQAARIKALRAIQAPDMPGDPTGFTSAVTGAKFLGKQQKAPLLGALTPLIAQTRAGFDEQQMNAQKADLTQRQLESMKEWFRRAPQGTAATPDTQAPLGPDEPIGSFDGDPSAAIAQMTDPVERQRATQAWLNQQNGNMRTVPGTPYQPPSRDDVMAHISAGQNLPMLRPLLGKYAESQIVERPEKLEERAYQSGEKGLDRSATLYAARAKAAADAREHALTRATTLEAARIRAQQSAANSANANSNKGTYAIIPDVLSANGNPVERHTINGDTREVLPPGGGTFDRKPAKPKEMTDPVRKEQNDLLSGSRTYAQAFQNYKDDYSGSWGTAKLASTLGQYTPIGEETNTFWTPIKKQQAIANHQLYGASFTGPEQQRADAYNPSEYKSREQNLAAMGQMAIDQGLAHLRSNYVHNNPGAYIDNDGIVVLPDGRTITDTRSRLITTGEVKSQKLNPIPTLREVAAANPKAGAASRSGNGAESSDRPAPMPKVGEVREGYRFKGGDPNAPASWEPAK